jgi:hypothetical protein
MDRSELYSLWQRNKDRPVWVRKNADAIEEHTDTSDPVPDGSVFEIRRWLDKYKPVVTRQLNDDSEGTDPHDGEERGETPTDAGSEGGA